MDSATLMILVAVIATALIFDFTNGFHDAANAIATSVSTRALSPRQAVLLAAFFNLLGAMISTEVAKTIAKGIVVPETITVVVVLAAVIGGITWNLITWRFGLPSSSSHALIGGAIGAVIAAAGVAGVQWTQVVEKMIIPTVISPLVGFALGALVMTILYWVFKGAHPGPLNRKFRILQTISASFMAFSHGSNDAQKTMGIMVLALSAGGFVTSDEIPFWVVAAAASAIALGTWSGGWRIIRTMGMRVVKLEPINGFAAETTAATVLMANAALGLPVSTTHVITSSIMGVGATKRLSAVRWGVARNIVAAWILTIPAAGGIAALIYMFFVLIGLDKLAS